MLGDDTFAAIVVSMARWSRRVVASLSKELDTLSKCNSSQERRLRIFGRAFQCDKRIESSETNGRVPIPFPMVRKRIIFIVVVIVCGFSSDPENAALYETNVVAVRKQAVGGGAQDRRQTSLFTLSIDFVKACSD